MRRDPRAYLWDAQTAADRILEFTRARSFDDYLADGRFAVRLLALIRMAAAMM